MELRQAKYVIPGEPVPWARPGGRSIRFDTQKQIKLIYGIYLREQHEGPLFTGPIQIQVKFFMPLSQRLSKKNAEKFHGVLHDKKPDIDNLLKLLLDCATGILFKDDACIACIISDKRYDKEPRTELTILQR